MKKIINKLIIELDNSFSLISILDLKTNLIYINMLYKTQYNILSLSNKIIHFPFFFSLYLFSYKKNILNTYIKHIKHQILLFYIEYKLCIEFIGTGYKFFFKNNFLFFVIGYSHWIKIKLPNNCNINTNSKLLSIIHSNKYVLGNIFFIIKSCKKLNKYTGKGIKNIFDQLKLKIGKTKSIKK